METADLNTITVQTRVKAPIELVWQAWTRPEHITHWNFAGEDWHCPNAETDFQVGGKFSSRMEAKDGSFGFDFWAIYTAIEAPLLLDYTLGDQRKVTVRFLQKENETLVTESFEPESENPVEMQRTGWQMILNNFKKYVESIT